MNVLHVLPFCQVPPNFGGAFRVFFMLKSIARYHQVTVLSFGDESVENRLREAFDSRLSDVCVVPRPDERTKTKRLTQFFSLWQNRSFTMSHFGFEEMQKHIDRILSNQEFDIVQVELSLMGQFRFNTDAIKILDEHNVEYDTLRRMGLATRSVVRKLYYYTQYRKLYQEEIRVCEKQDAILVTSARDKQVLDQDVPHVPKFVIPNGVDSSYFTSTSEIPERWSLVFTAAMNYFPNSDGIIRFLDDIFPHIQKAVPSVRLYVVGSGPPAGLIKRRSDNVIVTGYVEDVRPYVRRASVYVVPLWMGGGTRLKVLEAMAMRKPIVTTTIGCEGIDVEDGITALVRDDPEEFAEAVIELLRDDTKRAKLAENGYANVQNKYDWSIIGERLADAYRSIVTGHKQEK